MLQCPDQILLREVFFVTIIIGILGGLIGGYVGSNLLGWGTPDGFNLGSIGIATLGSILLLFVYRLVKKK